MTQGKHSSLLLIERILLLKSLSIFRDTPETILAEIAHLMIDVHIAKGDQIVKEGEAGSCMYIILDGTVKVHKGSQLLAKLDRKDFFGELALLDTETRSASVTAETDCMLFRIDQEAFYDMIESRPEVVKGVIKMLCKRIRAVNEQLIKLQVRL